ncbi:MAG TPA: Gfo/Idh/MocA family oxidoreductase [Candidatus Thermoplasmatota archaeon]|nr:Gfo/Idh/MocA family oxidoreductase [Candidatus Thermoplasmatota archaeon]
MPMTPRLGFVGLGWIGRDRLRHAVTAGAATPAAYLEPDPANLAAANALAPAPAAQDLDDLLDRELDGVVIASPNHLHPEQARAVAERGLPVFCQKPLAHRRQDAERVISAAEGSNVLLAVDWSYRGTQALNALRQALHQGAIGDCYHAELAFHNAYGPDKAWYRDPQKAGGGCLLDLGCHLVDALQWLLPQEDFRVVRAHLYQGGRRLQPNAIEDHAIVALQGQGTTAQVQSSWNVPSGGQADIRIHLFGTKGGLRFTNLGGSFYDFRAEHLTGTTSRSLCEPPDAWGGRQLVSWAHDLRDGRRVFRKDAWQVADNARLLEETYACAS